MAGWYFCLIWDLVPCMGSSPFSPFSGTFFLRMDVLVRHGIWSIFTSVLFLAMVFPSLQACVNRFPKCPIHYKHVCNIHLGWRLSPCQRLYIIQASCLATIAYHLALSMSVTASSANNIGSEPLNTDELKTHVAGNWDLQTNAGRRGGGGGTHSHWQNDWSLEWRIKNKKPASDHRRHALHFRPDSSDKTLVMYSPK